MNKEILLSKVRTDIETAESFFESYIKPKLVERYQIYNADPSYYQSLLRKLSKRSNIVSTDVADVVEWALPSLMRIFFGGEDVVSVLPRTEEDVEKAKVIQALINFQIQTQNPGFMIFYRWFKDALISGLGVIKCWWEAQEEETIKRGIFTAETLELLQANPNIQVVSSELLENGIYYAVSYKQRKLTKNQPVFENIPPNEFLYHPDSSNIENSSFVAHKKIVTADYLRRRAKEGVYNTKAVEIAIEKGQDDRYKTDLDYVIRPNFSEFSSGEVNDEARKSFVLYECYTKYDINEDGLLEPVIVTVVNDEILRIEENLYSRPPFFVLSPILQPYEIWGKSFADIIGDLQTIKTALIRQILINIALNNNPKMAVIENAVQLEDLLLDKEIIRMRQPDAIRPLPIEPLAPWTFNFLEYIEGLKENRTGVTRYNQGLDARSLNKTATGIQLIMSAAQQRLELIARIFAETGVKEFFRFLVELNQRFISQAVVIRLTNQFLSVSPDDIQGVFDLEVNAGIGVGIKEQTLVNLQQLISLYPQLIELGVATPKNVYNVFKKYLETMGFKNVKDFITEPARIETGTEKEVFPGVEGEGLTADLSGIPTEGKGTDIYGMADEQV